MNSRVMADSRELQRLLQAGIARHKIAGASVALLSGGTVSTAAAGTVNVATGVEFTPETITPIGSITKIFNATLVMQLVDEGLVDLNERVLRYLPDLKLQDEDALERITVGMLLNHTSGIDGDMLPEEGHDEETIEKGIARFSRLGQLFAPGAEFSYSNAATVIAGYMAQRIRRKSWYELVRERIFEPLQLEHAATLPEEALLHRAAVGHYLDSHEKLTRVLWAFLPLSFAPCGTTLMLSAEDLLTFARAHMSAGLGSNGCRILGEGSALAMQRIGVDNRGRGYTSADGMGIGWFVSESGLLNHGGGGPGIAAMLYVLPKKGFAAAILTNASHGARLINDLMEPWLRELDAGRPVGIMDVPVPLREFTENCNNYAGTYEDIFNRYRVTVEAGRLSISEQAKWASYNFRSTGETTPVPLLPLGEGRFLAEDVDDPYLASSSHRLCVFRSPGRDGKLQYLGRSLRLFRRTV